MMKKGYPYHLFINQADWTFKQNLVDLIFQTTFKTGSLKHGEIYVQYIKLVLYFQLFKPVYSI